VDDGVDGFGHRRVDRVGVYAVPACWFGARLPDSPLASIVPAETDDVVAVVGESSHESLPDDASRAGDEHRASATATGGGRGPAADQAVTVFRLLSENQPYIDTSQSQVVSYPQSGHSQSGGK
jgi:hypothetical protein